MDNGVANNKTYKDQYHFTETFKSIGDEFPSIKDEDKINQTIKENPYRSNVEIEGGEIVLQPDLTALFKAQGKRHSRGGMEVLLRPESFVFSDDKTLAFTYEDCEMFELEKIGTPHKAKDYTPAKVLKKNIDVKHYNTLVNTLGDPKKDDLAKKTASLMLEKYIKTLGNIAYVQEEKKNFPDGIPQFAEGTAPVYDDKLKGEIAESKQYAKYGGTLQKGGYVNPDTKTTYTDEQVKAALANYIAKYGQDGYEKFDRDFRGAWQYLNGSKPRPTSRASTYDYRDPLKQPPASPLSGLPPARPEQGPYDQRYRDLHGMPNEAMTDSDIKEYAKKYVTKFPENKHLINEWLESMSYTGYKDPNVQMLPSAQQINPYQQPAAQPVDMSTYTGWNPSTGQYMRNGKADPIQTPQGAPSTSQVAAGTQSGAPPSQWGLHPGDKGNVFKNIYGKTNAADKLPPIDRISGIFGYTGPKNNKAFQEWLYKSSPEAKAVIDKWHTKYDQGPTGGKPSEGKFDGYLGTRWQGAIKDLLLTKIPPGTPKDFTVGQPTVHGRLPQFGAPPQEDIITPNKVNGDGQWGKRADWEFTPWQKISQMYNWGQFANVKRYMPYRSRYNATYAEPSLLNPEQAVGDAKALANKQLQSLNSLNPIMRNAQAAQSYGQALNQIPGIRSQYDNQNAQITNQFRQYNNQVRNNETMVNMGNDQQYYREAIEGRKNFDNMRSYTANNAMNNVMRDVETNQKLAYNLLTQDQPAYRFDWRSGHAIRNPKSVLDVQGDTKGDLLSSYIAEQGKDWNKMTAAERNNFLKILIAKGFNPSQSQMPPNLFQKKGGKVKTKNPYRY